MCRCVWVCVCVVVRRVCVCVCGCVEAWRCGRVRVEEGDGWTRRRDQVECGGVGWRAVVE